MAKLLEQDLVSAIADAVRNAVSQLFQEYPNDTFYYCSIVTTGEGHTPCLTAWSKEELEKAVVMEGGDSELRGEFKWSYADSPFYCYGKNHFEGVRRLLVSRSVSGDRDSTTDRKEFVLRLRAMESAMAKVDSEGLFGIGEERLRIVINAEVMPPDHSNVDRAQRLNPPEALEVWMDEAAEP